MLIRYISKLYRWIQCNRLRDSKTIGSNSLYNRKRLCSINFGTGETITAGTSVELPSGLGSVHSYMGWQTITSTTSTQYKLREQAGMNFDDEDLLELMADM